MSIRPATPADGDAIQRLVCESFGEITTDRVIDERLSPPEGDDWRRRLARWSAAEVADPDNHAFVWEESGQVVGYVAAVIDRRYGNVGRIPTLAVDSPCRNRGIGSALVNAAIEFFREAGMNIVRIQTGEDNPVGQRLYPRLGFTEVSRQIYYAMRL